LNQLLTKSIRKFQLAGRLSVRTLGVASPHSSPSSPPDQGASEPARVGTSKLSVEDFTFRTLRHLLRTDNSAPQQGSVWRKSLDGLARKYGVFRIVKFALATGTGFLVNEVILVLGVIAFYHSTEVPSLAHSSFTILGLDALALGIGDSVGFMINERATVRGQGEQRRKGHVNWFVRWCKYQLAALLGNLVIVGVQLGLFATILLSPVFGNIVGAIVSYPVTYIISMRFVWGVRPLRG
jgi:putative flippase GtrA